MKACLALALTAGLIAGPALAQSPNAPGAVTTAPTPQHPSGVTTDRGAGSPGATAVPAAPRGTAGGPPNPQAGEPGIANPSGQGGSGSQ
ncbi:hypothetical protein [Roseomonas chloroacetimidivorans]|uniref:hypothetical protein n=1 Tax=Roseomonas chloroacetimidivorans TaxID=1766656 RepID=UPI003C788A8D